AGAFDSCLDRIREAGGGWVAMRIAVPLRRPWEGCGLGFDPSDGAAHRPGTVLGALRRARSCGARVALGPPFVRAGAGGHWIEGDTHPGPREPALVAQRSFDAAVHLAVLAEAADADLLVLGGELEAPQADGARTLASCRAIYPGPIAFLAGP